MFLLFSYEATASLAKPINRGICYTQLAGFSYVKLRSNYVNLCLFNNGMDSMSNFVKEVFATSEGLRIFKLIQ